MTDRRRAPARRKWSRRHMVWTAVVVGALVLTGVLAILIAQLATPAGDGERRSAPPVATATVMVVTVASRAAASATDTPALPTRTPTAGVPTATATVTVTQI